MAYSKQTWDANTNFTPSRMNYIEDGIETAQATAEGADAKATSAGTAEGTSYGTSNVKSALDNLSTKATPFYKDIKSFCTPTANAPADMTIQSAQLRAINGIADIYLVLSSNLGFATNAEAILNIDWSGVGISLPMATVPAVGLANNYGIGNAYPQSGYNSNWLFLNNGQVQARPSTGGCKNLVIKLNTIIGW